jgi:hypothetical protein
MGFLMKFAHDHRRWAIALWTAGTVPVIAFPNVAHAGFFDFLFGPPPAARSYAYPGGEPFRAGPVFRRRAEHPTHRHAHALAVHRKVILADKTDHEVGPQAPVDLMEDDSLRHGDAVMTQTGIKIFVGYSSDHHRPEDFRKISEIKKLSKRERSAFAALDASSLNHGGQTSSNPGVVTGRSASENQLTAGETIKDPNGRTIRYVGP